MAGLLIYCRNCRRGWERLRGAGWAASQTMAYRATLPHARAKRLALRFVRRRRACCSWRYKRMQGQADAASAANRAVSSKSLAATHCDR